MKHQPELCTFFQEVTAMLATPLVTRDPKTGRFVSVKRKES